MGEIVESLAVRILAGAQQFIGSRVEDALGTVIRIARIQQRRAVGHRQQGVFHRLGLPGQHTGGAFDQQVAAAIQSGQGLGGDLCATSTLELTEVNYD